MTIKDLRKLLVRLEKEGLGGYAVALATDDGPVAIDSENMGYGLEKADGTVELLGYGPDSEDEDPPGTSANVLIIG